MTDAATEVLWLNALRANDIEKVKELIANADKDVRLVFAGGSSPLHWCAESGSLKLLQLLLESELVAIEDQV